MYSMKPKALAAGAYAHHTKIENEDVHTLLFDSFDFLRHHSSQRSESRYATYIKIKMQYSYMKVIICSWYV